MATAEQRSLNSRSGKVSIATPRKLLAFGMFSVCALLAAFVMWNPMSLGHRPATERITKNIEDVVAGDLVIARDPATGEYAAKRVVTVFHRTSDHLRILRMRAANGDEQEFRTTDEHPFWVPDRGWVRAGDLKIGQQLEQDDGWPATLVATEYEPHPEGIAVHNFEVEGFHTYYVAQNMGARAPPVLVHNARYRGQFRRGNGRFGGRIGRPPNPKPKSAHRNTKSSEPATLYAKFDKHGKFQKWGITHHDNPCKRYSNAELAGGKVVKIERGPRDKMLALERYLTERIPGPDNHEPWAGSKHPQAP